MDIIIMKGEIIMKNLIDVFLQHTRKPHGFLGRIMLMGMNFGHASLAEWGMSYVEWCPEWIILDIGCGGGANVSEMLKRSPASKVYGVDFSAESRAFSKKKNRKELGKRCIIDDGQADNLPYPDMMFDIVTAFETIYFWNNLEQAFCEVNRVLKHGGLFMICNEMADPRNTVWTDRIEGMVIYSAEEIKKRLTTCGFVDPKLFCRRKNICLIACKK